MVIIRLYLNRMKVGTFLHVCIKYYTRYVTPSIQCDFIDPTNFFIYGNFNAQEEHKGCTVDNRLIWESSPHRKEKKVKNKTDKAGKQT